MQYAAHALPGRTISVEKLLIIDMLVKNTLIAHRTVVPLFTDVAGTVRLDCTVPEDVTVTAFIPHSCISAILRGNPSTSHIKISPVPPQ